MPTYEGVAVVDVDKDAGFRVATGKAVDDYRDKVGPPDPDKPVILKVVEMSVRVRNPIHEYIVVLGD